MPNILPKVVPIIALLSFVSEVDEVGETWGLVVVWVGFEFS